MPLNIKYKSKLKLVNLVGKPPFTPTAINMTEKLIPQKDAAHLPAVSVLVGVARLELAASSSQSWRATNCATPRYKYIRR